MLIQVAKGGLGPRFGSSSGHKVFTIFGNTLDDYCMMHDPGFQRSPYQESVRIVKNGVSKLYKNIVLKWYNSINGTMPQAGFKPGSAGFLQVK